MTGILQYIRQRLSLRLGIVLVLIILGVFSLLYGFLFNRSKQYVQQAAFYRATQLLDNTAARINGIMDQTEAVGNHLAKTTPQRLHPDSLLAISRRAIVENSFLTGMAISMEPYYFPEMGRYFSAYSLRYRPDDEDVSHAAQETTSDSITTVREGPFEYFDAIWYKTPRTLGRACWVEAYDDYNAGTLSSPDYLSSYCCPMRDENGKYLGSITASLTLKWLTKMVSDLKPYPHSAAIMIGHDGIYLVHPDTTKLFRKTIFDDAERAGNQQIEALGKDMIAGNSGVIKTIVHNRETFIFYRQLKRTGWSIAIVCPESDVFARYNLLVYMAWFIIGTGLLLLMFFCYQTIRRATQPLSRLDHTVRRIADGHFDEPLPVSSRRDSIGRLNNSFFQMQQSLAKNVADIQRVNDELQQQNEELTRAYQLKLDTNQQKTEFIHIMYHQIRTPLNIISGFTQVLTNSLDSGEDDKTTTSLPPDEITDITDRMREGADEITRLARELGDAAK